MNSLRRTVVGDFKIEYAVTLENLEKNKKLIQVKDVFKNLENIELNKRKKELFLNGVLLTFNLKDGIYNIYSENKEYIGIGVVKNNLLKRDIIL